MSELIDRSNLAANSKLRLLTTVSAVILMGSCGIANAAGDEDSHPTVWIELGGQLERMSNYEDSISPPFTVKMPRPDFETSPPTSRLQLPRYAVGGEGKLTFTPAGSNWVFTAAVRYGRSNSAGNVHNQTYNVIPTSFGNGGIAPRRFYDVKYRYRESHSILDFAVGRDVGLGLFGKATASLGVRYAQFQATGKGSITERPDFQKKKVKNLLGKYQYTQANHVYTAAFAENRNFHSIGPALSLNGATTLLEKAHDEAVTFDWGLNGALLFGRQRAAVTHNTYGVYHAFGAGLNPPKYHNMGGHSGSRAIIVPNVGGFAGLSMRYTNAKLSFGYRADLFFGAMDGGVDSRESFARNFYGPFATISIGLGG